MARTLVSARHGAKRCYAPFPYRCSSGATDGGGDFGGEIILFLLDAFAELETHIAGKRNKRTGFPARLRNDFRDRRLVVDYEKLAQKSIFLGELGNRPIHHFRNNLRWLAGFRSLFSGNRTRSLNQRRVNGFRSAERCVGKERVSPSRSRRSP